MYRVSKILNNNGVIAINTEDNQEYVLLGKGIGFGKKVSQRFEVTEDTATYRLTEQTDRGSAKSLVQEMDPEFLEIADEVILGSRKSFWESRPPDHDPAGRSYLLCCFANPESGADQQSTDR